MTVSDEYFMKMALNLALKAKGRTSPNPIVGAVLVKDGIVVGEGYHHRAGAPHAEINALAQAGDAARDATMYVTLEPCSHYGKTPPCAPALVKAGLKRVVVATLDPNPLVQGKGMQIINQAGIETTLGVLKAEADKLNEFFFKYITAGLPFVTLKAAMTMDGKIATRSGDSKWITNEESRRYVHELRNIYDAVLVGIGTVVKDDPRLNTRLNRTDTRDPLRVIIDGYLSIPTDSQVVRSAREQPTIIFTATDPASAKAQSLAHQGIKIVQAGLDPAQLPLEHVLQLLAEMNICSVLVEGGGEINGYMIDHDLVDKVHFFIAPKIAGGRQAPSPIGGEGREYMTDVFNVERIELLHFADDLLLTGYLKH